MREVAEYARRKCWDVVLLSEVRSEEKGVVWLGQDEETVAVVHSERAAVLLRGEALKAWSDGGMVKKWSTRTVSVKVRGVVLVSTYQPVWGGANRLEVEEEHEILEEHVRWASEEEILVVGGDFNAHVGEGERRRGVCGKFGLRRSNQQGRNLLEWCENTGLTWVNSYFQHPHRGTWWSQLNHKWYELDGFVMRNQDRQRYVNRVNTVGEVTISDHKPKKLVLSLGKKSWRKAYVGKRVPRIKWDVLREENAALRFHGKMEEALGEEEEEEDVDSTDWTKLQAKVIKVAEEVCGVQVRAVENPWMVGKEAEIARMKREVEEAVRGRREYLEFARGAVVDAVKEVYDEAVKDEWKRARERWEREWWGEILDQCEVAAGVGDTGKLYRNLRKLEFRGFKKAPTTTVITKEEFGTHFQVSKERFENDPEFLEKMIDEAEDLRGTAKAVEWEAKMNAVPDFEEMVEEMKLMRESAPGEDGVRLSFLLKGGRATLDRVLKVVQFMFVNGSDKWEDTLKTGVVIPLYKLKGSRNDPNNYRGVCLLSMGSRILARILASRFRRWSEDVGVLDDNQAGFRRGRATADATQMMFRLQEDATDLRRRVGDDPGEEEEAKLPEARLLDLRKAYPRVNKPALWRLLKRYGLGGHFLRALQDLHESTEYKVRGKDGESETWVPERGLREGCPSSPGLFNVFHQAVMRVAEKERRKLAEENNKKVGIDYSWVPGSSFPSSSTWEKFNSEAIIVNIEKSLFADDTTPVGEAGEIEAGTEKTKEVMGWFEERNNDDKEEKLVFGKEGSGKVRMLGSWMGWREDVDERLKRGSRAWWRTRNRLKGARFSKRLQARVIEASVESTLLFDCQARTWRVSEVKRLQKMVDKAYRFVWSRKNKPPLMQMQEEGRNMEDVRVDLGVKSLR